MIYRLIRKSYDAISKYGIKEFLKRFYIYFERKIRPSKYYHFPKVSNVQRKTYNEKRILFITGEPKNATSYYRCEIPAKQLESQGWKVDVVNELYVLRFRSYVENADYIIFYRTPLNEINTKVLKIARQKGIKTIFSVDDFVYRRDLIENLEYTNNLDRDDKERLLKRADGMMELMKLVDAGISSTEYLAKDMRKYIKGKVFVNRNGTLQQEALRQAQDKLGSEKLKANNLAKNAKRKTQNIILGYFSGSETHDQDFEMIWPAVEKILRRFDNVELWLGGRIDSKKLKAKNKNLSVRSLPFMDREKYINTLSQVDINLFPLEDIEFNRGKSEIKFLEAGLVSTPCIVSPIGDMAQIIKHGENGLLVENQKEWEETLIRLIENVAYRKKVGGNANSFVLKNYSLEKLGKSFSDFLVRSKSN